MVLTVRDRELLKTLAIQVRLMSLPQVATTWWGPTESDKTNARRRLTALVDAKLIRSLHVQARPLTEISEPVVCWSPGQDQPDLGAVAWRLQSRWTSPPRRTTVFMATRRGANQFGGRAPGKVTHDFQITHDLGVAQMYLTLRKNRPELADRWVGEDVLKHHQRRQKTPDAAILEKPRGAIALVLEFGGAYDLRRVQDFHRHCEGRGLPYEIW